MRIVPVSMLGGFILLVLMDLTPFGNALAGHDMETLKQTYDAFVKSLDGMPQANNVKVLVDRTRGGYLEPP